MILAVAIKVNDFVCFAPSPKRHHHIFRELQADKLFENTDVVVEGFMDDKGNFLSRREAYDHVIECSQPMIRPSRSQYYQGDQLFSEDLW
jgi:hypothetical protein